MSSRPRLLVFNQYYWPGVEATAHLLSELCAALASDFDVTVVTAKLQSEPGRVHREEHEGVEIVRVSSTAFDRSSLPLRALNYATYLLGSLRTGLTAAPPDVVAKLAQQVSDIGGQRDGKGGSRGEQRPAVPSRERWPRDAGLGQLGLSRHGEHFLR